MTIEEYYRKRSGEYDKIYETAEWQEDLRLLATWLAGLTRDRSVLEVAAGTGYWTQIAAAGATRITATDHSPAMLARAAKRRLGRKVTLRRADAYALPAMTSSFDVGMAHLWWSHVETQRQQQFLTQLACRLKPGATLLMIDQLHIAGYSAPALRRDRFGNRYELRSLDNGDIHQIVKNYPDAQQLEQRFGCVCDAIKVRRLRYFWSLQARLRRR